MARRNWFWVRGLAALVMVVAVAAGGYAIYRLSWSQGYQEGQLTSGTGGESVPPYFYPRLGFPGVMFSLGLIMLVLMVVIGKALRVLFWTSMTACGPWPRAAYRWRRRHHRGRHPMPPWFWEWDEQGEEDAAEPSAGADQAEV